MSACRKLASETRLADLAGLFPPGVAVEVSDPSAVQPAPFAEEAVAMARATPARQREFAAGRAAAHGAMRRLGRAAAPVPHGPDRAPRWPAGLCGSISHCEGLCLAAVAPTQSLRSLGVDVEPDAAMPEDLIDEVTCLVERAWLSAQSASVRGRLARLIFSAKEAAYKCQYPVSGAMIGFQDLVITPDLDTGQFEATLLRTVPGFREGQCFHGRFLMCEGVIVTAVSLSQGPRWSMQGSG
ncbi:4'-phosphopantetheinyl transferase family protein [Roseovarius nubinhibens]|uniref:Enterobactin synthase component D n=1 Tax=Roseovarius nubinhibens TaxID=314263 RepID=A0A348W8V4_9RHOB|nr:phosphopantetheinyl transferase [Roseovarius nubinhibens]